MLNKKRFMTIGDEVAWCFKTGLLLLLLIGFVLPTQTASADAPVIITPTWSELDAMVIGTAWSYDFDVVGDQTGIEFSTSSGGVPGLTLNSFGVLSGTPSTAGEHTITIQAKNNSNEFSTPLTHTFTVKTATTLEMTGITAAYPKHQNNFAQGYPVWVVVQLTPAAAAAGETVSVSSGAGNPSCTVMLDANGVGDCGLTFSNTGNFTITAAYAGNAAYESSASDPQTITVTAAAPLSPQLLAGAQHSCDMDSLGKVRCWGNAQAFSVYDTNGNITSSISTENYVQFSAGGYHSCGLKADGSIQCWGDSVEINNQVPNTIAGKTMHYIQINSGEDHVCAIDSGYQLHCWGELTTALAAIPAGQFKAVDAGVGHDCAIRVSDGNVECWGENDDGQGSVPVTLGAVKQVSVGSSHSCAIKDNGFVDCWGSNTNHTGSTFNWLNSGSNFTCGLTQGSQVECWGSNQIVLSAPGGSFARLGSGPQHVCLVRQAAGGPYLYCWGNNQYDQAPHLNLTPIVLPEYIPLGKPWSTVFNSSGGNQPYTLAVGGSLPTGLSLDDKTLSGTPSALGTYSFMLTLTETKPPVSVRPLELLPVVQSYTLHVQDPATSIVINSRTESADVGSPVTVNVTVSKAGTPDLTGFVIVNGGDSGVSCQAAVNTSGQASCALYFGTEGDKTISAVYGGDPFYQASLPSGTVTTHIDPIVIQPMITAGDQFNCSLNSSGAVTCWGKNDSNQLTPVALNGLPYIKISAGKSHVCGVAANSMISCWGWDGYSQVKSSPLDYGFKQAASGETHTCGLNYNGSITCWGNSAGDRLSSPAGDFMQIDAGANHTCAIRNDGEVLCWGVNTNGQTAYSGSSLFTAVSAGERSSCGISTGGGLVCWGNLTAPPSGSFTAVSVGSNHACAIDTSGQIQCWGDNGDGKSIPPAGSFTAVQAGPDHTCALRADGFLKCWGNNTQGQAPVLSIDPVSMPTLAVNQNWDSAFSVLGGRISTYTYQVRSGSLPDGLTLDSSTGRVSGQVTRGNDFTYTIQVFERGLSPALIAEKTYTQRVKADSVVTITGVEPQSPVVGQAVQLSFAVAEAANSGFAATPSGQAAVLINGQPRCDLTLSAGATSCLVFFDTAGSKTIRVNYAGDEKFLPADNAGTETEITVTPFTQTIQLRSGDQQTYLHRPDGTLTCVGEGCDLSVFNSLYPVFDSGGGMSCGLQTDGQVKCLAGGAVTLYPGPFKDLAVGEGHACALTLSGEAACWGANGMGQATAPVGVYTRIFAGEGASCALRADQAAVCWGDPAVSGPPAGEFKELSIGNGFACGLKQDGSVSCWGMDSMNQLAAPAGSTYTQIQSGSHHTCALDAEGLIRCWGSFSLDQPVTSPYGVFIETSATHNHVCALRAANQITCWGENEFGEAPQILVIHLDDVEISALTDWEHDFKPSGGREPYVGSVVYGSLPSGTDMVFSPAGVVLYGTPTVPGRYDFALRWADSDSPQLVLEELHRVTVTGADLKVEILSAHPTTALYDQEFWFDYVVSNQSALTVPQLELKVELPAVGFEEITYSGLNDCSLVDHQLTCTILDLPTASSLTLRVKGKVKLTANQELNTKAIINPTQSSWPEVKPRDNEDKITLHVAYTGGVVDEDFESGLENSWLGGSIISAPSGQSYLGDFANAQALNLKLENLAPHRKVKVQFNVYVMGDWQGNGTILSPLPALYQFGQTGQTALTTTTFCNGDCTQAYPAAYPGGENPAFQGAAQVNVLGFSGTPDAVYHFAYHFDHSADVLDLSWLSENLPAGARFGIDDVVIALDSGWSFVYLPLTVK